MTSNALASLSHSRSVPVLSRLPLTRISLIATYGVQQGLGSKMDSILCSHIFQLMLLMRWVNLDPVHATECADPDPLVFPDEGQDALGRKVVIVLICGKHRAKTAPLIFPEAIASLGIPAPVKERLRLFLV